MQSGKAARKGARAAVLHLLGEAQAQISRYRELTGVAEMDGVEALSGHADEALTRIDALDALRRRERAARREAHEDWEIDAARYTQLVERARVAQATASEAYEEQRVELEQLRRLVPQLRARAEGKGEPPVGAPVEGPAPAPTSLPPCYIAAPYAEFGAYGVHENICRAEDLGRIAASRGYAPIVVHSSIRGVFGVDAGENRARGLAANRALVELVALHPRGELWALERLDHELSAGTEDEVRAFERASGRRAVRWSQFRLGQEVTWERRPRLADVRRAAEPQAAGDPA